jgi:hypothetical protein
MKQAQPLCFLLLDQSRNYWWSGAGFRRIGSELRLGEVAHWSERAEARAEAKRLKEALGLESVAVPVRMV